MPELTGDDRQEFVDVLEEGATYGGYVVYEARAQEAINEHLGGHAPKSITKELLAYAQAGGKISRNNEEREGWKDRWRYCYHLWPPIDGRELYVEARFDDRDQDDPVIRIVNIHPPRSSQWQD